MTKDLFNKASFGDGFADMSPAVDLSSDLSSDMNASIDSGGDLMGAFFDRRSTTSDMPTQSTTAQPTITAKANEALQNTSFLRDNNLKTSNIQKMDGMKKNMSAPDKNTAISSGGTSADRQKAAGDQAQTAGMAKKEAMAIKDAAKSATADSASPDQKGSVVGKFATGSLTSGALTAAGMPEAAACAAAFECVRQIAPIFKSAIEGQGSLGASKHDSTPMAPSRSESGSKQATRNNDDYGYSSSGGAGATDIMGGQTGAVGYNNSQQFNNMMASGPGFGKLPLDAGSIALTEESLAGMTIGGMDPDAYIADMEAMENDSNDVVAALEQRKGKGVVASADNLETAVNQVGLKADQPEQLAASNPFMMKPPSNLDGEVV